MLAMDILAQTTDALAEPGVLTAVGTAIVASVTSVWAWFRGELNDCKKDRKELFARVESLHARVSELSLEIGHMKHGN
jgi:hypothetical protein